MNQSLELTLDYENLFRSLGIAYIIFDAYSPDLNIIEENQAHADIAMVVREDVIGKPLLEAFPDNSEEYTTKGESRLLKSIHKVIETGKPDTMNNLSYDLKDQNGVLTTKFWKVTHYPLFEGKQVRAVCQQTTDITDTILTRRKLTIAQDQLEQALAYSEVGTWMWNLDEDVVVADRNLAKLFGIGDGSRQLEVPLRELTKSIHPDDVVRVNKSIADAVANKLDSYESEYRTFDYTGNIRWLLARGHVDVDEDDEAIRFVGLVVDITERKLAENGLHILSKANTQFSASLGYRQTLDAIASMIVPSVADWCSIDILEDGKIEQVAIAHKDPKKVEWAKKLRARQGLVDQNASNGSAWVIRTGKVEHIPMITDDMLKAVSKNDKEYKLLRGIGFHSAITVPLKIDGKTIGAISFISTDSHRHYDKNDVEIAQALANRASLAVYNANLFQGAQAEIEERKKLQHELEQFNSALEDHVKERTLQLQDTNKGLQQEIKRRHKLENQRVQHYIDLNKTKDEFISLASHQLRTPATGVKQYLGMILEGMAGDITETQRAYLSKAYEGNERQLTIVSDLLKVAQVDAGKVILRQQTTNISDLLLDVIKEQKDVFAMRQQAILFDVPKVDPMAFVDSDKIRMVLENVVNNASKYSDTGKEIIVSVSESDNSVTITVKDNGVGIGADDMDKLFEKFNRIHNHLSNQVGGTGLGLYWAKKVVDLHGGEITVTSTLGEGSVFSILLPKEDKTV
ncbi:MAG: ATP-binding protein [Patescibacteria group bacterium]